MSDVPRKVSPSGGSPWWKRVPVSVQGTHHVLVVIALLSWSPGVRVAVPHSKLHGAAKGACSWRRERAGLGQWAVQAQIPMVTEHRLHLALCSVPSNKTHSTLSRVVVLKSSLSAGQKAVSQSMLLKSIPHCGLEEYRKDNIGKTVFVLV